MKIVIIEDEVIAADYLEKMIKLYDPSVEVMTKLDSVSSAVIWFQQHQPDLIFLDIHLGDDISFKIFEQVDIRIPVIFTTAYDHYAIRAFKLNSIDYLLKPIDQNELIASIEKYKFFGNPQVDLRKLTELINLQKPNYQERFLVSSGQKLRSVQTSDIAYFFAEQKLSFLADHSGKHFIVDQSLDKLETMIDPQQFFRINRQFIVSFRAIKNMISYSKSRVKLELEPQIDKETIVSVERAPDFKNWLNR